MGGMLTVRRTSPGPDRVRRRRRCRARRPRCGPPPRTRPAPRASPSASVPSRPRSIAPLARPCATRGPRANVAAHSSAASSTSSGGTTRFTRPMAKASSAATWRPVMMSSLAREDPIRRGRRCVPPPPGRIPNSTSGSPSRESSAPTRKSQARASSNPPPRAYPLMAAMVARGRLARASRARWKLAPTVSAPAPPSSAISAPAAKIRRPPQRTTAPGGSSWSAAATERICSSTATESAFAFGRSSRTRATPSGRRSTCTNGSVIAAP